MLNEKDNKKFDVLKIKIRRRKKLKIINQMY